MKKPLILILIFLSGFSLKAQEQITDFDSVYYWPQHNGLNYLMTKSDMIYFGRDNEVKQYDIQKDSLITIVTLPKLNSYYTFFVQENEIYAYNLKYDSAGIIPEIVFYQVDVSREQLTELKTVKESYPSFFVTAKGLYQIENSNLLRYSFNKEKSPTIDTLFHSGDNSFWANQSHLYFSGQSLAGNEKTNGLINKAGEVIKFPDFEDKKVTEVLPLGEGFLIRTRDENSDVQEQFLLEDGKLRNFPDKVDGMDNLQYFKVNNQWVEIYINRSGKKDKEIVINHLRNNERIPLKTNALNAYSRFLALPMAYMSPSFFNYSNYLHLGSDLYFIGNDAMKFEEGSVQESNLKLFRLNLISGDLSFSDANILLNKDLFMFSNTMGTMGFHLEAQEGNVIVYPNRQHGFKFKTFLFDTKAEKFELLETAFDPRNSVKTSNGYFNSETSTLLDESKEYFRTIGEPSFIIEKKTDAAYGSLPYEKLIETKDVLYLIHKKRGRNKVSTFNGGEAKSIEHEIFDNFYSISNMEVIECEDKHLLAVYGVIDTLAINGLFLYAYDLNTEELFYLGTSSHPLSGLGKPKVQKTANGSFLISGLGYYIKTDFSQKSVLLTGQLIDVLSDDSILSLKNKRLLKHNGITEKVLKEGVLSARKEGNKCYLLTESGFEVMEDEQSFKLIISGKPGAYGNFYKASNESLFFVLDFKAYLFNTDSGIFQMLEISNLKGSFSGVTIKEKKLTCIWTKNGETSLLTYDLTTNQTEERRLGGYNKVLFNSETKDFWFVEEKYGKENLNYFFKTIENGVLNTKYHFKALQNINFEKIESNYFKSHLDDKIYYFNADNYSIAEFNGNLNEYTDLQAVLSTGKDLLQVRKKGQTASYDIVEVNRENKTINKVKSNVQNRYSPLINGDSFFYVDSSVSGLKVYFSPRYSEDLKEEYAHAKSSPVEKYKKVFSFKNNVFSIGFSDKRGYQLYKLSNREGKDVSDEVGLLLASENPTINFSYFPNPTSDFLNIKSSSTSDTKYTVRVFNTEGKQLSEQELTLPNKLNVSDFREGIYLINVSNSSSSSTFRLIKK